MKRKNTYTGAKSLRATVTATSPKSSKVFWIGVLIFALGTIGWLWSFWVQSTLSVAHILPSDTKSFVEIQLNETSNTFFDQFKLETLFSAEFPLFSETQISDFTPWIGSKVALVKFSDRPSVFASRHRSKSDIKEFFQSQFLTPTESFSVEAFGPIDIFSAEFSSSVAFTFYDGWLLVSESAESLKKIVTSVDPLTKSTRYIETAADFPRNFFLRGYADLAQILPDWLDAQQYANRKPIIDAFALSVPAVSFDMTRTETGLDLQFTAQTSDGVFQTSDTSGSQLISDLVQFVPGDALFFLNGNEIYKNYQHTRQYLSELHPQFQLLFDGILSAQGQEIFGEGFDISADFLAKMYGQYGIMIDISDPTLPFPTFTLLTKFGQSDIEQRLSDFHEAVRHAQGKFATKIETVELPDGTERNELVATDPREILIKKHETPRGTYFSAENDDSGIQISYGFLENYFVFSTHRAPVDQLFAGSQPRLNASPYFQPFVLEETSASETYGILDLEKLTALIEKSAEISAATDLGEENNVSKQSWLDFIPMLSQTYKKILIARKNRPTKTIWNLQIR